MFCETMDQMMKINGKLLFLFFGIFCQPQCSRSLTIFRLPQVFTATFSRFIQIPNGDDHAINCDSGSLEDSAYIFTQGRSLHYIWCLTLVYVFDIPLHARIARGMNIIIDS